MNHFDVESSLRSAVILVDTREQDTPRLRSRLAAMEFPWERQKLDFGDYSIKCKIPNETWLDLSGGVAVERKMNLDELCACFCRERSRFIREFERARAASAKLYLLVEQARWEKIYAGDYRSQMRPQSLVASILAWLARYPCQVLYCEPETSGRLIRDILYRELKECLEAMPDEPCGRTDQTTNLHIRSAGALRV